MRKDPRKRYSTTLPFAWNEGEPVLFRGLMPRDVLPKTAYVEHVLRVGDRLDKLADEFYGDPRLWWVIAQANPGVFAPADLIYGPPDPDDALAQFLAGTTIGIPAKPGGSDMTIPQIFAVIEPASVQIFTGAVPVEITDMYPVLNTVTVQTGRNVPGTGTLELTLGRDETGAYPVLDGGYFERWKPIRIVADFGTYTEDVLWGHIVKMTPDYPADRGTAKVTIEFQDQTIAMDRAQVSRGWGDSESGASISDQAILSTILIDYGHMLSPDSANGQNRPTVTQDKTDFRFASELAEAVGYEMRLMFSEMYFGPINLTGEPQAPILVYAGPDTNCLEFGLEEEAAVPDSAVTAGVDDTGAAVENLLAPDLPILGAESARDAADSSGVPDYVWRLEDTKDAPPEAAALLAQAKINEASLSIAANCTLDSTIYGHVLLPGKLVTVDGIGERYGGRFYVDTVEHVFAADGYTQTARLLKNGINEG